MFLTTKGRYAVTAILDIAVNGANTRPVPLSQIAERQGISVSYLEQIFLLLKKHKLVKSVKGPGGGYILEQNPSEISIMSILQASGESIKMTKCQKGQNCTGTSKKCITHRLWKSFEDKISNYLTNTTILEIMQSNASFFESDYAISSSATVSKV